MNKTQGICLMEGEDHRTHTGTEFAHAGQGTLPVQTRAKELPGRNASLVEPEERSKHG